MSTSEIDSAWWVFREEDISYNDLTTEWEHGISKLEAVKYLKGIHTNKERFIHRFLKRIAEGAIEEDVSQPREEWQGMYIWPETAEFLNSLIDLYDEVESFTYQEAFELTEENFRRKVFGTIDITQMIKNLGAKRIAVDGETVTRKTFDPITGECTGTYEKEVIYETHEVNGEGLGLRENAHVVKCWCSSTESEHWLWVESKYKNDPKAAIASTCRLAENVIDAAIEIKRQGDIFLVETGDVEVIPEGSERPLTKEEYFGLITAES